jgi:Ca-activated chloride channel homolog
MKANEIRNKFLEHIEGSLSETENELIARVLKDNPALASEYEDFKKFYASLQNIKVKEAKAPEGFTNEVMKVIETMSPVKERRSSMKNSKGFFKFILITVCLAGVLYFLFDKQTVDNKRFVILQFIEAINSVLGGVMMVLSALTFIVLSVIYLISAPARRIRGIFPVTTTLATISLFLFLSRAATSNLFGPSYDAYYAIELPESMPDEGSTDNSSYKNERLQEKNFRKASPKKRSGSHYTNPHHGGAGNLLAPQFDHSHVYGNIDAYHQPKTTEEYAAVSENSYQLAIKQPLSTFSIDVDTASYSNVRRFINMGQLPPRNAVRIEEMINYFSYDYTRPETKEVPFAVRTELSSAPWSRIASLLHVGLKGFEFDEAELPASNLVFLIDVSGSMQSPDRLPLLKSALRLLVEKLRPQDQVSIVTYAGDSGIRLGATLGSEKTRILRSIDSLVAAGSTNGGAGITLAYQMAKDHFIEGGNNRVIIATDGDFNVGLTSHDELISLIERQRASGIFLSVLGFGRGNLKDHQIEQLANKGNGFYAYIDSIHEARKVLVSEFQGSVYTIAKDVKIQIEFNPAYVQAYRLVGYENRMLNKEDFNDDRKDAGELGAGHTVTALYEIIPVGVPFAMIPSVDPLKYQKVEKENTDEDSPRREFEKNDELATVKLRYKLPDQDQSALIVKTVSSTPVSIEETSDDFRFSAAVAQFGMLLGKSEFRGETTFESAILLAKGAKGKDEHGYRSEFVSLVDTARLLKHER